MRQAIRGDEHWRQLRAAHVGGSEIPSLFDCGYESYFHLWHQKAGTLPEVDHSDDERIVIGRCVEAGIAKAAGELLKLDLLQSTDYCESDEEPGMGATPDFLLPTGAPVEIKNVSWEAFRDHWSLNDDGSVDPPRSIELQLQQQMECLNVDHGMILALVAGNRLYAVHRQLFPDLVVEMRRRVHEFWASVNEKREPQPNVESDLAVMQKVWPFAEGEADLRGEVEIEDLIRNYATWNRAERDATEVKDKIKAELFVRLKDFSSVVTDAGRVSLKTRDAVPARNVEHKAQAARRDIRVTPKEIASDSPSRR